MEPSFGIGLMVGVGALAWGAANAWAMPWAGGWVGAMGLSLSIGSVVAQYRGEEGSWFQRVVPATGVTCIVLAGLCFGVFGLIRHPLGLVQGMSLGPVGLFLWFLGAERTKGTLADIPDLDDIPDLGDIPDLDDLPDVDG